MDPVSARLRPGIKPTVPPAIVAIRAACVDAGWPLHFATDIAHDEPAVKAAYRERGGVALELALKIYGESA